MHREHLHGASGRAREVQRLVLLELVADPPARGDPLAELAARLRQPFADVAEAVETLRGLGLAEREGDVVRASPAARAFDALWPVRP